MNLTVALALALSCLAAAAAPTVQAAECSKICPTIIMPVCASNGKTYSNNCVFGIEKCTTNDSTLTIVKTGECTGSGAGAGTPACNKEFACLDVVEPVCGSNGMTYSNKCVLQKAQCMDKTIQKAADGECKKDTTTTPTPAPTPSTSASSQAPATTGPAYTGTSASGSGTNGGSVGCSKACTKEIDFVCGSDNVTYANACLLEEQKTCGSPTLTKASSGECTSSSAATNAPAPAPAPSSSLPPAKSSAMSMPWTTCVATFVVCVFMTTMLG